MTANQKIKVLTQNNEDREWYPTTDEILSAMNNDLHFLFTKGNLAGSGRNRKDKFFDYNWNHDRETGKDVYTYFVKTFLDVS